MRIVCKVDTEGNRYIYRPSDNGRQIEEVYLEEGDWGSKPMKVRRLSVFVEVGCDENPEGIDRAVDALRQILGKVEARVPAAA